MKALEFFYDVYLVNLTTMKEVRAQSLYGKDAAVAFAKKFNQENAGEAVKAIVKSNNPN
jgi:hypothetical protein